MGNQVFKVDLKQLCRCFAFAIKRHIDFSQERELVDDLGMQPGQDAQKNDFLKISYVGHLDFEHSKIINAEANTSLKKDELKSSSQAKDKNFILNCSLAFGL